MKNGIGLFCAPIQELHGFFRWEDNQFHLPPVRLTPNLIHDWQCSGAGTDHQPMAIPRYLLFQRERCVTEIVPELLRLLLLALANLSTVDHDVISVVSAIDPNVPK